MSEKISRRRHVVCVDGVGDDSIAPNLRNPSSITRLHASIKTGSFSDQQGRVIKQDVQYYRAITAGSKLVGRLGDKSVVRREQQVEDIVHNICEKIETPADEIFLFGSGQGAYTVRAVAGIFHHMGIPKSNRLKDFTEIYNTTLTLIKARETDDSERGGPALQYLRAATDGCANIQFVGLLDATKSSADKQIYDTRTGSTIRHFRHALAFNENRVANPLDLPKTPAEKDLVDRSFVQAWFLGYHTDVVGGVQHDGFSLYPLQWIMLEAMQAGLSLSFEVTGTDSTLEENPLALVFPQCAGLAPDLNSTESKLWQLHYTNNIEVKMSDIQSVHVAQENAEDTSHALHFENINPLYSAPRKIFHKDNAGLIGYESENAYGTIIHPSVFCILDRNQRFLEQKRFKACSENLADFETNCLRSRSDSSDLPPWLQDSELLDSGVKAFRILVCGKTGVGKSTLINKVFGVEMTEESDSYTQGQHDINLAFESPNHPGLLIHDSRGWQAGSDDELELIAKFLRHRAFQKDPAEALHVIWFCVDSDVSRIEEADKRTFETIAQYSNTVPVFVVGTKKDKLVAYRKMSLLEDYMKKTNDYQESSRLANEEANKLAEEQFTALREQLAQIKWYHADGYVCISRDDDSGIRSLLTQTLDMIADERVRLFCVAAQVVDVDKKIDSAITECMRLGTHAIRSAMVPLPFSGMVSTPTVSRIICEHVLLCFGFPKAVPEEVEEIMTRIVLGNLTKYLAVSMTQFLIASTVAAGLAVGTIGAGALIWFATPMLSAPASARMLLKCSAEMILILERSFRYGGKYVSVKQIEDAAKQFVSIDTTTFSGKKKKMQIHIRDEIDRLVPLRNVVVGFRFGKLRSGLEHIIYKNRFDQPPDYRKTDPLEAKVAEVDTPVSELAEAPGDTELRAELPGDSQAPVELDNEPRPFVAELAGSEASPARRTQSPDEVSELSGSTPLSGTTRTTSETVPTPLDNSKSASTVKSTPERMKTYSSSSGSSLLSRMGKSIKIKKSKTKE